jgi:hypothetical protein
MVVVDELAAYAPILASARTEATIIEVLIEFFMNLPS